MSNILSKLAVFILDYSHLGKTGFPLTQLRSASSYSSKVGRYFSVIENFQL